ncbi:V-type ATP synthase subunit B, partial [Thermococci archaeon]
MKLKEYSTIREISGPLMIVEKVENVGYGEVVEVIVSDTETRLGQVLETSTDMVVVQVFEGTTGLDTHRTRVRFTGEPI